MRNKTKIDFNWRGVLEQDRGTNNWPFFVTIDIFIRQELLFCEIL